MLNGIFVKTQKNRGFWAAMEMLTDVKTAKLFLAAGDGIFCFLDLRWGILALFRDKHFV
jgi:hypothetical protein